MLPLETFQGRSAFVTGGGTGLGAAIANGLARLGADLIIGSRKPEHYEDAANRLRTAGASAIGVELDIRDPDAVECALDAAETAFGRPVGLLVNNAAAYRR